MTLLERILDENVLEWREESLEKIRDAETLPGMFGAVQKTVLVAEIDLKAIDVQIQINEQRRDADE